MRWLVIVAVGLSLLGAGCAQPAKRADSPTGSGTPSSSAAGAVPNVVGVQLDDAKKQLKGAGFTKVDSYDAVEKRTIIDESNWIVVTQDPQAGQQADPAATVRLGVRKKTDPQQASPTQTTDRAAVVRQYIDGFKGTTWYPHISEILVTGDDGMVWVKTDLFADAEGSTVAKGICSGVSGYVFSTDNTIGVKGVTVRAADGQRLVYRATVADSC